MQICRADGAIYSILQLFKKKKTKQQHWPDLIKYLCLLAICRAKIAVEQSGAKQQQKIRDKEMRKILAAGCFHGGVSFLYSFLALY